MKKKTYEKPLTRAIQLNLQRVLLIASPDPNAETEDINEQRDWEHQEGGWS
ncbi:hypothetical protein L6466_05620 [Prevotella communis]|uniref:hypothetical protein n=1 Tax=Prevotella communis TaxID=2913614 RepID=UPI001EDB4E12|nr:hypothetical protein [Prevotella communis]UKK61199.1 hypothetical protein L6468_09305 [Prevotella communis]UKK64024.1 hypothetical protein L6473_09310 [Prevotella communis]UKK69023.1 hypothetical protein L6464_06860 [Prevotella communis]UKK71501.1 hypothetical protein L6466_05620 [Prevotella communis]